MPKNYLGLAEGKIVFGKIKRLRMRKHLERDVFLSGVFFVCRKQKKKKSGVAQADYRRGESCIFCWFLVNFAVYDQTITGETLNFEKKVAQLLQMC